MRSSTFARNFCRKRLNTTFIGVTVVVVSNTQAGGTGCTNGTEERGDTISESFMPAPGEPRRCHRRSSLILGDHDHVILVVRCLAEPLAGIRDVAQKPRITLK